MATGIANPHAQMPPSAYQQTSYGYKGGVQYVPYSPTHSGSNTPTTVSPTNNSHHMHLHSRQLRPPRAPMYVPAVLRPTERPPRSSPPKGSEIASPSDSGSIGFGTQPAGDGFGSSIAEIERINSQEDTQSLGPVTGPPSRNHWKSNEATDKCNSAGCNRVFTMFCRRHHCRRCGDIFCYEHSAHEIKLDQDALFHPSGQLSRACDGCWSTYRQWETARNSSRTNSASSQGSSTGGSFTGAYTQTQGLQLPQPRGVAQAQAQTHRVGSYVGSVPRDWNWSTF